MAAIEVATDRDRRRDLWCAAALMTSAAFQVAQSTGRFVRTSATVHLVAYSWAPTLVVAIALVVVARSFATGVHRDTAAAFIVGFSALALFGVIDGFVYLTQRAPHAFTITYLLLFFSAAVLEVGVGIRALGIVRAQPRSDVGVSLVLIAIVALAVLIGVGRTSPIGAFAPLGLATLGAVSAIPLVASRRAQLAVPMLFGLVAGLILVLASRSLLELTIPREFRGDPGLVMLPAIVSLAILAIVVRLRATRAPGAESPVAA